MSKATPKSVKFENLFLDLENPRFVDNFDNERDVIAKLCQEEKIRELAQDIATHGLNPLELFALIETVPGKYTVVEGNRRLCAIKLLHDPDLAPANQREAFKRLSSSWTQVDDVLCFTFANRDDAQMWLDRIHDGDLGGIGRSQWSREAKIKRRGGSPGLSMLDYAEKNGYLTVEERKGRLSIVEEYLNNSDFQQALGVSVDGSEVTRVVSEQDFEMAFGAFIGWIKSREISTRTNRGKENIAAKAAEIRELTGYNGSSITSVHLAGKRTQKKEKATTPKSLKQPPEPQAPIYLAHNQEIADKLKALGNYKLEKIFWSLTNIEVAKHVPMLSVALWSFLESLTALKGRTDQTSFYDFLNANTLTPLGFSRDTIKTLRQAIKRVHQNGNTTKHSPTAAEFNGDQLINDFETLAKMIDKICELKNKS